MVFLQKFLGISLLIIGTIFLFLPFSPGWLLIFSGFYLVFGKEFTEKIKKFLKIKKNI